MPSLSFALHTIDCDCGIHVSLTRPHTTTRERSQVAASDRPGLPLAQRRRLGDIGHLPSLLLLLPLLEPERLELESSRCHGGTKGECGTHVTNEMDSNSQNSSSFRHRPSSSSHHFVGCDRLIRLCRSDSLTRDTLEGSISDLVPRSLTTT
ncbi:uncharacterized protein BJX67DRAFT_362478 [Aspergillus lucknowensis]|uniref:Uncharacterized protein n=1 Tax=Aspergillus lucknowensis TaxID=176173 RepID=A0ABR4LHA2_9EURO